MRRFSFAACAALGFLMQTIAAQAQQTDPCHSNDPADFDAALATDCETTPYEPGTRPPDNPPPTIEVSPQQQDYSGFRFNNVTDFFGGLDDAQKARVVAIAAQHGLTDGNNQPMSVEEFGSLTRFIDTEMTSKGMSDTDKRQFLGQLAAEANVYQGDPTYGQTFGDASGARYDFQDAPKK